MKEKLQKIKALVHQGRSETAISELTGILSENNLLNDAILHSGRLSALQKQIQEGAVNWEDVNTTHDNIMRSVLGLVEIIEEEKERLANTTKNDASKNQSGNVTNVVGDKNNIIGKIDGDVNINNH